MKTKLLLIILFLLGITYFSKAQDPSLPKGKSTIYLISGKTIKNVELWKIDSLKIEFVKDGNLSEVRTAAVSIIIFADSTKKLFNNATENNDVSTKPLHVEIKNDDKFIAKKILIVEKTTKREGQIKPKQLKFKVGSGVSIGRYSSDTVLKGSIKSITDSTIVLKGTTIYLKDINRINSPKPVIFPVLGVAVIGMGILIILATDASSNSYYLDGLSYMLSAVVISTGSIMTISGIIATASSRINYIENGWKIYVNTIYVKKPTGW